jgi:hypothetical protein
MKKLPIGIQDFSKIRKEDYLYVDKTQYIFNLLQEAGYYFLSRPRRFGKSLLLSTLSEIFSGNRSLFEGLWIEDKIDWEVFPVVHLSFGKGDFKDIGLRKAITDRLEKVAKEHDLVIEKTTISSQLEELIEKLYQKYQKRVVLLIDEYDKPIIDFLGKDEIHIAEKNREIMKEFYSPIKGLDPYLRFFLLTGVSKFSKVSIFSDLNNLDDISLGKDFALMLGYTEQEIIFYFDAYLDKASKEMELSKEELMKEIRLWYNGYNFDGLETVYNPFSVLNFFKKRKFDNYWIETGTPTFLIKLMAEGGYYDVSGIQLDLFSLGNFEINHLEPLVILFQTGFLTIKEQTAFDVYRLGYPNKEVKNSMLKLLLREYASITSAENNHLLFKIKASLKQNDIKTFFELFNALFAKIPHQIFEERLESYYHAIIYLTFTLLGYYAEAEVSTSRGRIDVVVKTLSYIYILEFKVRDTAQNALQQIKENQYPEKYKDDNRTLVLIGVACQDKKVIEYVVE